MTSYVVGDRVAALNSTGVIVYVGEVNNTTGIWYGVEWDDKTRGKHDGTLNGVYYFTASSKTAGSFIRSSAILPSMDFYDAVRLKYGTLADNEVENLQKNLFVTDGTRVDVIGMERVNKQQSEFNKLKVVSVEEMAVVGVSTPRPFDLGAAVELNLSSNLIVDFATVVEIVSSMPRLEILDLSLNRFTSLPSSNTKASLFNNVHTLSLNKMDMDWEKLAQMTSCFRNLRDLRVIDNRIRRVETYVGLDSLRQLSLQNNAFDDWQKIDVLANLPNLKKLVLDSCGLTDISYNCELPSEGEHEGRGGQGGQLVKFAALESLSLSRNKLTELSTLNALSYFPCLTDLQLTGNNFTADADTAFNFAIAKCTRLTRLNKTQITKNLRREAEVFYINHYGNAYLDALDNANPIALSKFTLKHPSWCHLIEAHGAPSRGELSEGKLTTINQSLIHVIIKHGDQIFKRKIPTTLTIIKLRNLINMLTKKSLYQAKLTYTSTEMTGIHLELDNDSKDINYYCMENGDVIHIQ